MKKIIAILLAIVCLVALSVPAFAEEKPVTIILATGDAIGSFTNLRGKQLEQEIANRPELGITINHIEGAVLGSAAEIMDQVAEGSVGIFGNDMSWFVPYDADLQPTSFGFMFRDKEHYQKFLDSDIMDGIAERVAEKNGIRLLSAIPASVKMFFSIKPLESADDIEGLKVRAPGLEMYIESYKSYGMAPTTIAWNEIFLALKTGVCDAAHGPVNDVIANQWHLVAPYITPLDDMYAANTWVINEGIWKSLSETQQAGLLEAIEAVNTWAQETSETYDQETLDQMIEEGAILNENFEGRDEVREKALEHAKELEAAGKWSEGLVDKIQGL